MEEHALLEDLLVGNRDLERLESLLSQFNIFEALGPARRELRHSDFLAFLLDPRANHSLGDAFLKRLLKPVVAATSNLPLDASGVEAADLTDAWVDREWQNIDILVRSLTNDLVCVIENKIESSEHSDQLRRYRQIVQRRFPNQATLFVYLTPEGAEPSDEVYVPLSYHEVIEAVDAIRTSGGLVLEPAVRMLLEHYVAMVRRHVVEDSEIVELCRRIYREHREALDLIYEHRLDLQEELREYLVQLVQESADRHRLRLQHSTKWQIHFTVKEWDRYQAQRASLESDPRDRILAFKFRNEPSRLHLSFVIDHGPQPLREAFYAEFRRRADWFNELGRSVGQTEKVVHQLTDILDGNDYEEQDLERMQKKVRRRWQRFLRQDLPRIEEVVDELSWEELAQLARSSTP